MPARLIQPSYAAGELSPNLYARVDIAKYKVGAALLRNFVVDFRGGASNRAGTQFVAQCKNVAGQPRLLPFLIGEQNAYSCEFGNAYVRFFQNGLPILSAGIPVELVTPYLSADLPLLKYVQSASVLTLTHPNYPPADITLTGSVFSYTPTVFGPTMPSPINLIATATNAGDYSYGYVATAVSLDGKEESLPSNPYICHTVILDPTLGHIVNISATAPASPVSVYRFYKWGPLDDRQSVPASIWGFIGSSQTTNFTDNNIAADFSQEPPNYGDPVTGGQIQSISVTAGGSVFAHFSYVALTFTDATGSGAAAYGVVNYNGVVSGAYITNPGKNYTAPTVTAVGDATFTAIVSSRTPLNPAVAAYFQQRKIYGGSTLKPETLVLSVTGKYTNFNTTPVSLPTDAIAESLASTQVNTIKSFQPVAYGLICFTTGGTFLLSGGGPTAAITPSSTNSQVQASNGANDLPPIRINYSILYVQNKGNIVRDLSFAWQRQSYTGSDISTFSNHLFYNQVLTEWTWSEEPYKLVYVVRADGKLLTLTYVPDQEIYAWAHSDTNGWFRSVCSVPEGGYNVTYVIVQRLVGGLLNYYVERLNNRVFDYIEDAWFLDCALALPQVYPSSILLLSAASGNGVTLSVSTGVYTVNVGMVGSTLWCGAGKALVTAYVDPTHLTVNIIEPFATVTDDPLNTPSPLFGGTWSISPNVTTVSGLSQLNGLMVSALADGVPIPAQLCSAGAITLPFAASKVVAGLGYTAQFQTLKLDTGEPTTRGQRKTIPALSVIVDKTLGISMGPDFNSLTPIPSLISNTVLPASEFVSDDARVIVFSDWNIEGQICAQQTLPLPVTILGIVPEVVIGDTGR